MRYQLEPTPEVVAWLLDDSHPQQDVRLRVQRKFNQAFRYIRESGPYVGKPHLRKLRGYDIYEIRIEDVTGWYRIFFNSVTRGVVDRSRWRWRQALGS